MAFDVRTFNAAHEPWSFTDDRGRVWQPTRQLSAPAAVRWLARLDLISDEIAKGALNQTEALDRWVSVTRRIIRQLFPWRLHYWWSGDPSRAFDAMAIDARQAAVESLFRSRGLRTSTPLPKQTPTTPRRSSASSRKIPSAHPPAGA